MKDVLVLIGAPSAPSHPVQVAAGLAAELSARLTVCFAARPIDVPSLALHAAGPSLYDDLARDAAAVATNIRELINPLVTVLSHGFEWIETGTAESLVRRAHSADLVVVGRGDNDGSGGKVIEDLIMTAGRPVLVVPTDSAPGAIGRRVTIGWNGSREAARALHDALPLLANAAAVELVIVAETAPSSGSGGHGEQIRSHLGRYGMQATVRVVGNNPAQGVDGALLACVREHGSDLLIMGAYGRSRLRELTGGVTTAVLRSAAVPVLLSH